MSGEGLWLFECGLSVINIIVFASFYVQHFYLISKQGLTPVYGFVKRVKQTQESDKLSLGALFMRFPTLFLLNTSDEFIQAVFVAPVILCVMFLLGIVNGFVPILVSWICYSSIVTVSQPWLGLQMHANILEIDFLYLVTAPFATSNHYIVNYALKWFIFRFMLSCGLAKWYSSDESWRRLTAMNYHYETQPLPNMLSPFFHKLPNWIHKLEVVGTLIVEIPLCLFVFIPHWSAQVAAFIGFVGLNIAINSTGNFGHLGLLTIIECIPLIPDDIWRSLLPFSIDMFVDSEGSYIAYILSWIVLLAYVSISIHPSLKVIGYDERKKLIPIYITKNIDLFISKTYPVYRTMSLLRICNYYSKFTNMTKERWELVIEGSYDNKTWAEYVLPFKPGPTWRKPRYFPLHMPCLDWQMWFVPLRLQRGFDFPAWYKILINKLRQENSSILPMFYYSPFPANEPPKYIRTVVYKYSYSSQPEEVWERTQVGIRDHN
eukprot:TRINITY_DN3609_c0_g1_i1.p1 TRINITY_DN3609_c0_g1~~TRINITY_DN3609_c0_g1_i1.p1  ORF type:complete len:496 (-),score=57.02 TRINITY_DN3609_c0_g1_i1:25-1491(-)